MLLALAPTEASNSYEKAGYLDYAAVSDRSPQAISTGEWGLAQEQQACHHALGRL
jgi:hypothetical protein